MQRGIELGNHFRTNAVSAGAVLAPEAVGTHTAKALSSLPFAALSPVPIAFFFFFFFFSAFCSLPSVRRR